MIKVKVTAGYILLAYVALARSVLAVSTVATSPKGAGTELYNEPSANLSFSEAQNIFGSDTSPKQASGTQNPADSTQPNRYGNNSSDLEHWSRLPDPDSSSNLIFSSVAGLLQHWHNARYRNGHTVVPVTISPGTLLYHGRDLSTPPQFGDWLSFDFDHSYLFFRIDCYMYTYVASRPLKILYLDGSSGAKMSDGPFDSQDIIIEGKVVPGSWRSEFERVPHWCDLASKFGLDGFMRMEFDFEVIYCDFKDGLELVTGSRIINQPPPPPDPSFPVPSETPQSVPNTKPLRRFRPPPLQNDPGPLPFPSLPIPIPAPLPTGWVGSLRSSESLDVEAIQAGNWHNFAPGVNGIRVDYSRLITFFDPRFRSLVEARRGLSPDKYRLLNISQVDVNLFTEELKSVLARTEEGSGVDWGAIMRNVMEKHAQRLEYLKHILSPAGNGLGTNATATAIRARQHVMMMLSPYLLRSATPHTPGSTIPSHSERWTNTTWLEEPIQLCSAAFTPSILFSRLSLTSQERLIRTSIEQTVHEICRTLGVIWVDAFVVEKVDHDEASWLVKRWKKLVDDLIEWLDWSIWVRCNPECGPDHMCTLPQWPFDMESTSKPGDVMPRCIPRE